MEGFPADAKICREIPLEFFYKNDRMTAEQKSLFLLYTDRVNTLVSLKAPHNDSSEGQIYCPEIQILEVHVKTKFIGWQEMNNYVRLILHPIPYPTLLLINYKDACVSFSIGKLRKAKNDSCRNVVEGVITAYWVEKCEKNFIETFAKKSCVYDSLEKVYHSFCTSIDDFIGYKSQRSWLKNEADSVSDEQIQKLMLEYENDEFHIRQMLRGY